MSNPIAVLLAIIGFATIGFFTGMSFEFYRERSPYKYAFSPEGCARVGMTYTGRWFSTKWNGGIENGGMTEATNYECKP